MSNYERHCIIKDNAEFKFNEAEEFQKFLTEMDKDSTWLEAEKSKDISVFYAGSSDDIIEGLTDEAFNDTVANGSCLSLQYNGQSYYIGLSALPTLKARACISGTALEKVSRKELSTILNTCLSVSSGGTLIRICGDKVRACHSKNYQPLSQSGIFRTARTTIEGYSSKVFTGGSWNHDYMTASWNICDKDVIDAYVNLFDQTGIPINKNDIQTIVSICTSDVGTSGATVWYNISCKNRTVVLGAGYKLNHKGAATLSDFSDNLRDVFTSYKKNFYDVEALKNVTIKHPVGCIYGLLKKADLPCSMAKETALRFNAGFGNEETDGLILYVFGISEILSIAKEQGVSLSKLFTYQEKVARVIGYDFSNYDKEAELVDL
jgi:hypothetical protein